MRIWTCCVVVGSVLLSATATAVAVPPTVNVIWLEIPPPTEDFDYVIDDTDPHFPKVELISASDTWWIWSVDTDNPDDVGDIGEVSCPNPQNFGVRVVAANGLSAGARDVKGISLIPSNTANYSNLVKINMTGNVIGDLKVQTASGGSGGVVNDVEIAGGVTANVDIGTVGADGFTIGGDVGGNVEADAVDAGAGLTIAGDVNGNVTTTATSAGAFTIEGSVTGAITLQDAAGFTVSGDVIGNVSLVSGAGFTIGGELGDAGGPQHTLDVVDITGGNLTIGTLQDVSMTVSSTINNGRLRIEGQVLNSDLTIEKIENCPGGPGDGKAVRIGYNGATGVTLDAWIRIQTALPSGCTLDLERATLERNLLFLDGGSSPVDVNGDILIYKYHAGTSGFGALAGQVIVTTDLATGEFNFAGGVLAGALVDIGGDCSGLLDINGDLAGRVWVRGDLKGIGKILVWDHLSGMIEIDGAFSGQSISVGGDLSSTGVIDVAREMDSVVWDPWIWIQGEYAGNITIGAKGGDLDGDIIIDKPTVVSSFVKVGGIGSEGTITVNADRLSQDTYGAIQVGFSKPPKPVTFDGSIMILDGLLGGGWFEGFIDVYGCHATDDPLDICMCRVDDPSPVSIHDYGCDPTVGESCVTGCP